MNYSIPLPTKLEIAMLHGGHMPSNIKNSSKSIYWQMQYTVFDVFQLVMIIKLN